MHHVFKKTDSSATNNPAKYQKRRDINDELICLLASSVLLWRRAHLLGVTYKMVRKHRVFVGEQAKITRQNQRNAMLPGWLCSLTNWKPLNIRR